MSAAARRRFLDTRAASRQFSQESDRSSLGAGSAECGERVPPSCQESVELRLFLEAVPLTSGKLRVDEDELWADYLGLQREHGTSRERRLKAGLERADLHFANDQSPQPFGTKPRVTGERPAGRTPPDEVGRSSAGNGLLCGPPAGTCQVGQRSVAESSARRGSLSDYRVSRTRPEGLRLCAAASDRQARCLSGPGSRSEE